MRHKELHQVRAHGETEILLGEHGAGGQHVGFTAEPRHVLLIGEELQKRRGRLCLWRIGGRDDRISAEFGGGLLVSGQKGGLVVELGHRGLKIGQQEISGEDHCNGAAGEELVDEGALGRGAHTWAKGT